MAELGSVLPYMFDELFVEIFTERDDVFEVVGPEDDGAFVALESVRIWKNRGGRTVR